MADVRLHQIRKSFGGIEVIKGVDLEIDSGDFVVFVGPSGCGKSTLLRLIAGLEEISEGTLEIGGLIANDIPPDGRGIAMVFQSYALYPHMSVYDNMAFGLRLAKTPRASIDAKVRKAAAMLQLTEYLQRLPKQLSGGQRQRVAIGRAITRDPDVFLFDEPLSNLDAALRVATRVEIANLKAAMPETTMIYVTHDQTEAMTLADRIVVLNEGRIEQVGTPLDLYHHPENVFVAQFIGSPSMNILPVTGSGHDILLPGGYTVRLADHENLPGQGLRFGIRPEHLRETKGKDAQFRGRVINIEHLGEMTIVHTDIGEAVPLIAKVGSDSSVARADDIYLTFDPTMAHVFDSNGRAITKSAR